MEDRRAHERIDNLEVTMNKLIEAQLKTDTLLRENTELTKQLVANTQTLVDLVRGARWLRGAILWLTPVVAALYASWAVIVEWFKTHIH